jgi:flagellar biogenesis protein FliO
VTRLRVSLALAAATAVFLAATIVPTGVALGQETPKSAAGQSIPYKQEASFADQLVKAGFALAAVIVIGALGIGIYRYFMGVRSGSPVRRLKVVETLRLAPRTSLFLVEFDRRTLLIGQHGDRLSLIDGSDGPGSRGLHDGSAGGNDAASP